MDAGKLMEMDHPHILLNKRGYLSEMVERTGPGMAASLRKMAEKVTPFISKIISTLHFLFRILERNLGEI